MEYQIASKKDRILAALIDHIVTSLFYSTIIGIPLGVAYVFLKDTLAFNNYQSVGKKIMNIRVVDYNYQSISPIIGFKRYVLFLIPIWGAIECLIYLFRDSDQRVGDKFSETYVIKCEKDFSSPPLKSSSKSTIAGYVLIIFFLLYLLDALFGF